ncbi:MAG: hypothetical protein O3B41_03165 [Bacteroidetes bacterium]|nr:hypothetical protein [Bacteroidota bacterium]
MYRNRSVLWIGVVLMMGTGLSTPTEAQSLTDGSIYSRFGVGLRRSFNSSRSQAMGGGGIALPSSQYLNTSNPASYSDQYLTRFSGGLTYEKITASAEGSESSTLASGSLSGVNFGFPLKTNVTGVGISFAPYSRMSYHVDVESNIISDPEANNTESPYLTSFKGSGGLQSLSAGIGHRVSTFLYVGSSVDFIFGILDESQNSSFNSTEFTDRSVVGSTRLSGISATAGFRFIVPNMPESQGLVVAGTIHLPTTLKATRSKALVGATDRDTLGTTLSGNVNLPFGFGLGVAYQPVPKWTLISDFEFENWSGFKSDLDFPGYDANGIANTNNRVRISAGAEFWPAARRPFATWTQRIAYRLGLYTEQSYISPLPDQKIGAFGVTGGLSIPSLIPGTTIDFNLDVGQRGKSSNGLIQDRYVRFGLNLNFGERWFDRPPLG